ncbi:asparaginase [Leptolyngbya cf. ectocarpi LEGE 11479]|uniref:Asparaginase n=1 Tax=Leptolyngbya cf. ectocarpi LEGE 11479 TaxID=1828722 RepID=A0A928ZXD1_LEPEC|nr:asparaginase [Leptolyngbya ectocarpi]MBE9069236.1 asparaginase [Leptolyngbya cf. ectocarpi LEGE 11479]
MPRPSRISTAPLSVQLLREGIVESVHQVHAAVADSRGRLLSSAGDADNASFIRSALKPFQAMSVTSTGALDTFKLTDKDLAIMCGSHQGRTEQARQVFGILWRADLEPTCLQCPIPTGQQSALQHNCSGKHAGMLAVCKQQSWELNTYLNRNHPLQKLILNRFSGLLGMPADEFIGAHDDCGAPTYFMQLRQMATLYAKLASGENLEMERVVRAMTHHPDMVAGPQGFDTEVMRLTEGKILSKSGAEGIQCISRVGEGLGLALKVVDGSKRAKYAAALHVLRQLGWISPDIADTLAETYLNLGAYKRLDMVGEIDLG